ncbi:MAG TPA: Gfo/Idh/MocA family oxidoreductase [Vicinamibacterales bacterium]|nr:Gfo/Idh/MocA family oxidoreductase [Vicinamibacterales bacterium]
MLGCGSIGRRHLRNLHALGSGALLAFDPQPAAAEGLTAEIGVATVTSLEDVWAWRPDAVVVASPSHLHLSQARAALAGGAHLFVEKPVSHTMAGVPELASAARAAGLVTMVGCNMRFHPGPAGVKRILDSQRLGRPFSARIQTSSFLPDWRPTSDYRASYSASNECGGGAILDCIHEIDLALWYFGEGRLEAAAMRSATSIGLDVEGFAELLIAHQQNTLSSVHLSFVQRDYRRGCQIACEDGTIYWDFAEPVIRLVRGGETTRESLPLDWAVNQMYLDEMSHFLDAVQAGRETMCPIEAGQRALALALAARHAAQPSAAS